MVLTAEQAVAKVEALYGRLSGRRPEIAKQEAYFRGEHPLAYATPEWQAQHAARFRGFSDNFCGVVGSAPAERTVIDGFRLGEDSDPRSDDERLLWDDWQRNEMPGQSAQGFQHSTIAKRHFVTVWGSRDDVPVVSVEHPAQAIVDYEPGNPRVRRFALKAWLDDDRECATLYTPERVYKFERPRGSVVLNGRTESGLFVSSSGTFGGGWTPRQDDGDDAWPLPNPLGEVPVVEMPNRPVLGGEPLSDIAGAIAMQDALNLMWAYLFVAADFASMPARVVMGQAPPKMPILDSNGQVVGERPVDEDSLKRGRMLWLTGQSTTIGKWDAAALDAFTEVMKVAVSHLSAQTRTPLADLMGELGNVNGETLQGLAQPLAMKVRQAQAFYTPRARDVFALMAKVRGNDAVADACRVGIVQWRNPEVWSVAQVADAAAKDRSIGLPLAWVAEKRLGYSQEEVARLMRMVEAEATDPYLSLLGDKTSAASGGVAEPAVVG